MWPFSLAPFTSCWVMDEREFVGGWAVGKVILSFTLAGCYAFQKTFSVWCWLELAKRRICMRFGEQGSNRSKIAQNYSLMSSSVIARICPADLAFFSFLHTAPCSSSSTAGFTDQELGWLTHRGKRFQRLLQLLIPIHFCCWVSLAFQIKWLVTNLV